MTQLKITRINVKQELVCTGNKNHMSRPNFVVESILAYPKSWSILVPLWILLCLGYIMINVIPSYVPENKTAPQSLHASSTPVGEGSVGRGESKAFLYALEQMGTIKWEEDVTKDTVGFELIVTDTETGDSISGTIHRQYAGTDLGDAVKSIPKGYRITGRVVDGKNVFYYTKENTNYPNKKKVGTMEDALTFAKTKLGYPYVWGGKGLVTDQFDCSSFSRAVYSKAGIKIPRTANGQYQSNIGQKIKRSELKRGDAIYFLTNKKRNLPVTHVAIYLGDNRMIHTNTTKAPLRIQSLKGTRYWNLIVGAKRFI